MLEELGVFVCREYTIVGISYIRGRGRETKILRGGRRRKILSLSVYEALYTYIYKYGMPSGGYCL